jgi:hypothetical protein
MAVSIKIKKQQEQINEDILALGFIYGLYKLFKRFFGGKSSSEESKGLISSAVSGIKGMFSSTPEQEKVLSGVDESTRNILTQKKQEAIATINSLIEQEKSNIESGASQAGGVNLIDQTEKIISKYYSDIEQVFIASYGKKQGVALAKQFSIPASQFDGILNSLNLLRTQKAKQALIAKREEIKNIILQTGAKSTSNIEQITDAVIEAATTNTTSMRTYLGGRLKTKMREQKND